MDYKKLFRSRRLRRGILNALSFIPDTWMIRIQYRIKTNRWLNLKHPTRFSEKLQWYKLYHRDQRMIACVDKFDVRQYVADAGMGELLTTCYGVYDRPEDVDFDALPESFVLKDTLAGGGTSVILVEDKSAMDRDMVMRRMREWVAQDHRRPADGREWPYYSGKPHRIIAEELIRQPGEHGLIDYKLFCFDGRVDHAYVMGDRKVGEQVSARICDRDFRPMNVLRNEHRDFADARKPACWEQMVQAAERLAADFPHVRVDLYCVEDRIIFGELTFYSASGYLVYEPDSFDVETGARWKSVPVKDKR